MQTSHSYLELGQRGDVADGGGAGEVDLLEGGRIGQRREVDLAAAGQVQVGERELLQRPQGGERPEV